MSRARIATTVGRAVLLVLLLVAMMIGPWTLDYVRLHEDSCAAPNVWLQGRCGRPLTFADLLRMAVIQPSGASWFLLPQLLPFLSTALLLIGRERAGLWIFHLAAWGLATADPAIELWLEFPLSELLFEGWRFQEVIVAEWAIWGAGLYASVAVAALIAEIVFKAACPSRR